MPDVTLNDDPNDYTDPAGLSNRIFGLGGRDTLRGADGNDTLIGGMGNDILYGGTGFDQVHSDPDTGHGVEIDLIRGQAFDEHGGIDRLFEIEGARGTNGNDTLIGGNADNLLSGLAGNDLMNGGVGSDTLDGGAGYDTVQYDLDTGPGGLPGPAGVTVDLVSGSATDGFGDLDTLIGIEAATGTAFGDSFIGNAANNRFTGNAGNDTYSGGYGTDLISDADGFDEVRYDRDAAQGGAAGVTVNLVTGGAIDGFGTRDDLSGIEAARGTAFADSFFGDGRANRFWGLAGDDVIRGGDGFDEASYEWDAQFGGAAGIVADLTTRTVVDGFGATDWLAGIEGIVATNSVDRLTGDGADNGFTGLRGNDVIQGGDGFDEVRYDRDATHGGGAGVTVNLVTGGAIDGFGTRDVLAGIEAARGTAFGDSFFGNAAGNLFSGLGGNDTIRGGDGIDMVSYALDAENGGTAGIVANLSTGIATDGFGATDRLTGIEGIVGTRFSDRLTGDAGNNSFDSLGGNDTIDGGAGIDTIHVQNESTNTNVNLARGTVSSTNGTDTLVSIENVVGSTRNDLITGNAVANLLSGGEGLDQIVGNEGDDTLIGGAGDDYLWGGAGADQLIGGDGLDRAYYTGTVDLVIRLDAPEANTGSAAGDTYSSIEYVGGGQGNDTIYGDAAANFLFGERGNDTMDGRAGSDVLNGGSGDDSFRFSTALGANNVDTIVQFGYVSNDRILLHSSIFADIGATLDASEFGSSPGANRYIIFEQGPGGTGRLLYDAGGAGSGPPPVLFATFVELSSVLGVNDFVIV